MKVAIRYKGYIHDEFGQHYIKRHYLYFYGYDTKKGKHVPFDLTDNFAEAKLLNWPKDVELIRELLSLELPGHMPKPCDHFYIGAELVLCKLETDRTV